LQDANGSSIKLSEYKGKVVLLDFWATWCNRLQSRNPVVHGVRETPITAKPAFSTFRELHVPRDFDFAAGAPRCPEVEQDTLPLYSDNLMELPFASCNVKSGGVVPSATCDVWHAEKTEAARHTKITGILVNSRDEIVMKPLCG